MTIIVAYKNKNKQARQLVFVESNLDQMWFEIKTVIEQWAEILWVYKN